MSTPSANTPEFGGVDDDTPATVDKIPVFELPKHAPVEMSPIGSQQSQLYESYGLPNQRYARYEQNRNPIVGGESFSPATQAAYPFTTENITAYIDSLPLRGAKIAAIGGSGDFGLSAIAAGAESVDSIDILQTGCLYAELKTVGASILDRSSYKLFFGGTNGEVPIFGMDNDPTRFNAETYKKLRGDLSEHARNYFDQLIYPDGPVPYLKSGFLVNKILKTKENIAMVPYLVDDITYEAARQARKKTAFHPVTMQDFLKNADDESYDAVYLSNIKNYLPKGADEDILANVMRVLKPDGVMIETGFTSKGGHTPERVVATGNVRAAIMNASVHNVVCAPYIPSMPDYGTFMRSYKK